jgi:uncharacterized damage-inducible protein DinB
MARWSDGFLAQWEFIHGMSLAFADEIPDEHWDFSPHMRFGPYSKQLRHVVCVRGVYNDAIATGSTDFRRKHEHYDGDLSRASLRAALLHKQAELVALLASPATEDPSRAIDFFGQHFTLAQYTHVIVQHEAIHQGEWGLYASLAGFETPLSWRLGWGL